MKRILYLLSGLLLLTACQEYVLPEQGEGECILELDITQADMPVVVSRVADEGLAVTILDDKGNMRAYYSAGNAPDKVVLTPGIYSVYAYTENQDTWHTANQGMGEACYYGSQCVELEHDQRVRLSMTVPMTNYAVGVELPESFSKLFNSYRLAVKSGSREVVIREGEKAYFDIADGGFTYTFSATNIGGDSYTHASMLFSDIQSGRLFLLDYSYGDESLDRLDVKVQQD